ncbi:hypothetical protein EMPG_17487 [Blastomyces silverae]|uniref:Uncharacterized protein n=1 Tax=Blastomyces silverae TaxID=2060906 RepID=A0A0H1B7P0_9EURO|nr:hypothetical protein EMPG_17487 [Blastomyces silverae]
MELRPNPGGCSPVHHVCRIVELAPYNTRQKAKSNGSVLFEISLVSTLTHQHRQTDIVPARSTLPLPNTAFLLGYERAWGGIESLFRHSARGKKLAIATHPQVHGLTTQRVMTELFDPIGAFTLLSGASPVRYTNPLRLSNDLGAQDCDVGSSSTPEIILQAAQYQLG